MKRLLPFVLSVLCSSLLAETRPHSVDYDMVKLPPLVDRVETRSISLSVEGALSTDSLLLQGVSYHPPKCVAVAHFGVAHSNQPFSVVRIPNALLMRVAAEPSASGRYIAVLRVTDPDALKIEAAKSTGRFGILTSKNCSTLGIRSPADVAP